MSSRINKISSKKLNKLDRSKIASIQLKDGTIIHLNNTNHLFSPQKLSSNKYQQFQINNFYKNDNKNYYQQPEYFYSNKQKNNNNIPKEENNHHYHHRDGFGSFGQHFETIYNEQCPNCTYGKGGIVKARPNYILYVSKNLTKKNVRKKKGKSFIKVPQNQSFEQNNLTDQVNLKNKKQNKKVFKKNKNEISSNKNNQNDDDIVNYEEKNEVKRDDSSKNIVVDTYQTEEEKKVDNENLIVDTYEVKEVIPMKNTDKNKEEIYNENNVKEGNNNKEEEKINESLEKEGQQGQKYKEVEFDEESEKNEEEEQEGDENIEEKITNTVMVFGPSEEIA